MNQDLYENFLNQYSEKERKIIKRTIESSGLHNVMGVVLDKNKLKNTDNAILPTSVSDDEKSFLLNDTERLKEYMKYCNKRLLGKIVLFLERHGKGIDSLTEFLIMTYDEPERRKYILDKIQSLSNTNKKDIVLKSITAMMKRGNITLEDIYLSCCDDKDGIVLNAQLENRRWLIAIDNSQPDEWSKYGSWITFFSDKKADEQSSKETYAAHKKGNMLGHDHTIFELGILAQSNSNLKTSQLINTAVKEIEGYDKER